MVEYAPPVLSTPDYLLCEHALALRDHDFCEDSHLPQPTSHASHSVTKTAEAPHPPIASDILICDKNIGIAALRHDAANFSRQQNVDEACTQPPPPVRTSMDCLSFRG